MVNLCVLTLFLSKVVQMDIFLTEKKIFASLTVSLILVTTAIFLQSNLYLIRPQAKSCHLCDRMLTERKVTEWQFPFFLSPFSCHNDTLSVSSCAMFRSLCFVDINVTRFPNLINFLFSDYCNFESDPELTCFLSENLSDEFNWTIHAVGS